MLGSFILKIKRAETPFYRFLKRTGKATLTAALPLPRFVHPVLLLGFYIHNGVYKGAKRVISYFYVEPLFRGRCVSIGKRFHIHKMPFVVGQAEIHVGDDVNFFGLTQIFSGRVFDHPQLIIKDRVDIGHDVLFSVNREIVIEEDVNIAGGVRFMDSDGHPRDTMARTADLPPPPEEIKPIRVCRRAWIGGGSCILKGVTIGEGAIIGANSVVVNDIPAYTVAMGNPARVVLKNLARPEDSPASGPAA